MHSEAKHEFPYRWNLKDTVFTKDKGTVLSCFSAGGGSTLGYKLAGYDVIGCVEQDPKMINAYIENNHPKFPFLSPVQLFKKRQLPKYGGDLPIELESLDILDGSPPCSSFSMSGNREEDWGKKRKFKEGDSAKANPQVLDTLFFDFIDIAKQFQPKVVVAENVKGMLMGNAIAYATRVYKELEEAGYVVQHWVLNSAKMGVPQARERVFFIGLRKDLAGKFMRQVDLFNQVPHLDLDFNEQQIPFGDIANDKPADPKKKVSKVALKYYDKCEQGAIFSTVAGPGKCFNWCRLSMTKPMSTITTGTDGMYHPTIMRPINDEEIILGSSFPLDYKFGKVKVGYICGMAVPPLMTAHISKRIYEQWLSKI